MTERKSHGRVGQTHCHDGLHVTDYQPKALGLLDGPERLQDEAKNLPMQTSTRLAMPPSTALWEVWKIAGEVIVHVADEALTAALDRRRVISASTSEI